MMENETMMETLEQKRENLFTEFGRLDDKDLKILIKFYFAGRVFPFDTQPYCFPVLEEQLRASGFKIGREAIRKRMERLTKKGFLIKVSKCNPKLFYPLEDESLVELIREMIQSKIRIAGYDKVLG